MDENGGENVGYRMYGERDHTVVELDVFDTERLITDRERQVYINSLSSRQMESLTALCDTFLPPIKASNDTIDESLSTFFRTSASMAGTPQYVRIYDCFYDWIFEIDSLISLMITQTHMISRYKYLHVLILYIYLIEFVL